MISIHPSAFALPCAIPLIQLTSASRPGATSAPRTPSVRVEEGGGVWVFILRIRSVFGVRDLVWGVIGLGMVRA